jgi:hypothetical protein
MVRERLLGVVGLLCATVLAGSMGRFAAGPTPAYAAFTLPGTATDQLAVAADALEAAMAKGGSGLTFEVVQRNTLHAKAGGPLIGSAKSQTDGHRITGGAISRDRIKSSVTSSSATRNGECPTIRSERLRQEASSRHCRATRCRRRAIDRRRSYRGCRYRQR